MGEDEHSEKVAGAGENTLDLRITYAKEEGVIEGKKQAEEEYQRNLRALEQENTSKLDQLRQELLSNKTNALKLDQLKRRVTELETIVSETEDQINVREIDIVLDYSQQFKQNGYYILKRSRALFAQARKESMSLQEMEFVFTDLKYIDAQLEDNIGYKLFTWIADKFAENSLDVDKNNASLTDVRTMLRYFRAKIDDKEKEEVKSMITRCTEDDSYCARLKTYYNKRIEQEDEMHANYVSSLNDSAIDILNERSTERTFKVMLNDLETRLTMDSFLVSKEFTLSQIEKIKELSEYEAKYNIDLCNYLRHIQKPL